MQTLSQPALPQVACVVNGKEVQRPIDCVDTSFLPPRTIPVIEDHEIIVWMVSDTRPHIMQKARA